MDLGRLMDFKSAKCCHLDCEADADFEIVTVRATEHGDGIAGPDPYSDTIEACELHVGALLGFQPDAVEYGNIYWHVRTLAPVMLSR